MSPTSLRKTKLTAWHGLQAAKMPKHSLERHLVVAAFAVAPYSAAKKTRKSMYALHGETFEAVMPQKRVRYLAEQVCRLCPDRPDPRSVSCDTTTLQEAS